MEQETKVTHDDSYFENPDNLKDYLPGGIHENVPVTIDYSFTKEDIFHILIPTKKGYYSVFLNENRDYEFTGTVKQVGEEGIELYIKDFKENKRDLESLEENEWMLFSKKAELKRSSEKLEDSVIKNLHGIFDDEEYSMSRANALKIDNIESVILDKKFIKKFYDSNS